MDTKSRWLALALAGALLIALPACGGDDDDDANGETATPTTSSDATPSPSGTAPANGNGNGNDATPTEQRPPSRAEVLAFSPQWFIYVASEGDTVASVADMFDASPDAPSDELIQQIIDENGLTSTDLQPGQKIGVPVMLPGDLALFAENSIEEALAIGQAESGGLVLLQPSLSMREGFLGRLVLHQVELQRSADTGYGYVMEYWVTDRPVAKGGVVDPDARVAQRQFTVAGGSMVERVTADADDTVYTWERDGVQYALKSFVGQPSPQELAEMLSTAAER